MDASHELRQLRILTGTHAGASLDLSQGRHTLGERHDLDISITDWRFDAVTLHVAADGTVLAQWGGDAAPHALCFEDFAPVDFDGVVVCLGPCDAAWPPRPELLARLRPVGHLVAPSPAEPPVRRLDRRWLWSGAAAVIALVFAGGLATATSKPRDQRTVSLRDAHVLLQRELDAKAGGHLQVAELPDELVVEGLLDDAAQAKAAERAMDAVPAQYTVARKFTVATDVVETIRSALDMPGARISYRGGGVFAVDVDTNDVEATRAAIARVANDLAPTVRRIDAVLGESPAPRPPMPAVLSAWVSGDGTNVMETRDGVKHLVPADEPASWPDRAAAEPPIAMARQRRAP